jgi:hypothetical protein
VFPQSAVKYPSSAWHAHAKNMSYKMQSYFSILPSGLQEKRWPCLTTLLGRSLGAFLLRICKSLVVTPNQDDGCYLVRLVDSVVYVVGIQFSINQREQPLLDIFLRSVTHLQWSLGRRILVSWRFPGPLQRLSGS